MTRFPSSGALSAKPGAERWAGPSASRQCCSCTCPCSRASAAMGRCSRSSTACPGARGSTRLRPDRHRGGLRPGNLLRPHRLPPPDHRRHVLGSGRHRRRGGVRAPRTRPGSRCGTGRIRDRVRLRHPRPARVAGRVRGRCRRPAQRLGTARHRSDPHHRHHRRLRRPHDALGERRAPAGRSLRSHFLGCRRGAGIAVAGYAFNAIANQVEDAEWLRAISPYSWAFHQAPLAQGSIPAAPWRSGR